MHSPNLLQAGKFPTNLCKIAVHLLSKQLKPQTSTIDVIKIDDRLKLACNQAKAQGIDEVGRGNQALCLEKTQ